MVSADSLSAGELERKILNILESFALPCEEEKLGFRRILIFNRETVIGYYVNDHEAAYLKHSLENSAIKTLVETVQESKGSDLNAVQILIEEYALTKNYAESVVNEHWKSDCM